MRKSVSKLGRPIAGLAALALVGSAFASPANAAPAAPAADTALAASLAASDLAFNLGEKLGTRDAGSFVDEAGTVFVNVTDATTAAEVKASGATPRYVLRSGAALAAAEATLKATLKTPGTSFAVDPKTNKISVTADETVTGAKLAAVKAIVAKLGDKASLEQVPGTLEPTISGGDAIYGSGYRCSLGFNTVNSSGAYYFVTAGHCTDVVSTWSASSGGTAIGTTYASSFPGNDYGVVRYTSSSVTISGAVGSQDITSSGTPSVGAAVSRRGSTTGIHSGTVTALNATVNYSEGTVTGLIRTNVCAESGDSGGSLYRSTVAYGLTSGGSGNCTSGGITYFQPVTEVLSAYGLSVF